MGETAVSVNYLFFLNAKLGQCYQFINQLLNINTNNDHMPREYVRVTIIHKKPKNMNVRNAKKEYFCRPAIHLPKKPQWWSKPSRQT